MKCLSRAYFQNCYFFQNRVKLHLNVNHTVDTDPPEAEVGLSQDNVETGEVGTGTLFQNDLFLVSIKVFL